jgi:hypothetical protein
MKPTPPLRDYSRFVSNGADVEVGTDLAKSPSANEVDRLLTWIERRNADDPPPAKD